METCEHGKTAFCCTCTYGPLEVYDYEAHGPIDTYALFESKAKLFRKGYNVLDLLN